jgi:hypothetical protein
MVIAVEEKVDVQVARLFPRTRGIEKSRKMQNTYSGP